MINNILFTEKPSGINTHRVDTNKPGWLEYINFHQNLDLYPVHRLDKETSGTLIFAKNKETASKLYSLFKNQEIKKTYLFITDKNSSESTFDIIGDIKKTKDKYSFEYNLQGNSRTLFKRLKRSPFFELWSAEPLTGKTHQIRLHAQHLGLPILGDITYGGSSFPTLCLHSLKLELPTQESFYSHPPVYFERLGLCKDPFLIQILSQLDQRQKIYSFLNRPEACLRGGLVLSKNCLTGIDILGPYLWVHCYQDEPLSDNEKQRFKFIADLCNKNLIIQYRQNRGRANNTDPLIETHQEQKEWIVKENDLNFILRTDRGSSYGLFLDQRLSRKKTIDLSLNRKILNLFCYTGGFSVCALHGGAESIVSVDINKNYLEWAKKNCELNNLPLEKSQWICQNAMEWLNKIVLKPQSLDPKKPNRFDLIICDPPTFARVSKSETFQIEKSLQTLINLCYQALLPKGILMFSCNIEKQSWSQIHDTIKKILPLSKIEKGHHDLDFELSHHHGSSKIFWIYKP